MSRLTDNAGILRRGERELLEVAMERISRRCPQVFVAVYTGALGEVANIRQFGFWLLNRATFEDVPEDKPNAAGVLITIDPESKAAGMAFGYLLDPFLEEADTFECLSRGHAYWLEQRYVEGLVRVLAHLEVILCKRSRQARRDPDHYQRKVQPPVIKGDAVERLRSGHRNPPVCLVLGLLAPSLLAVLLAGVVSGEVEPELPVWRAGERARWEAGGSLPAAEPRQPATDALDMAQPPAEEIAGNGTSSNEVPEKYWPAYFEERPREFLVDPQGLLSAVEFRDRLGFLKYHAGDSAIDLFVYVFKGEQEIPGAVREEESIERFFPDGRLAVMVYYYLGVPQRSVMYLSPSLADVVPASERLRALESSVMQAVGKVDASGQFEAFLVQMSTRIYRMERMLGGGVAADAETPVPMLPAKARDKKSVILKKLQPVLASARHFTVPVAVLVGALVVALGMNSWLRKRALYRFPELQVEPRLGGTHAAGVGAVISFASAALSPASQRDQGPDYLRRA
ncbi:MAG: hypothetical protein NTV46_17360 [Verrucomicrobia bacterium]|nr:hypothetical protein [Verrucomicrobiota bacterium]